MPESEEPKNGLNVISILMPIFGLAGSIAAISEGFEGLFVIFIAAILGVLISMVSFKERESNVLLTYIGLILNLCIAMGSGLELCGF